MPLRHVEWELFRTILDDHRAHHVTTIDLRAEDCVAGMKTLPAESIDIVVTSPPYNLDIAYSEYRDNAPRASYLEWSDQWTAEVHRLLKPEGSFFLNVGAAPANPLLPHELILRLQPRFRLQNTIHWIKSITVQPRGRAELSVGHFKPLNSKRFLTDCHEYIFHLTKSGNVPIDRLAVGVCYADKTNIARWGHTGGKDRRCRGNNWFIPYQTIMSCKDERPHPATFPPRLAEMCARLHGASVGMTMLDPFLGLGNSALAALECRFGKFIGFETDPAYLAEAKERVAQAQRTGDRLF